MKTLRPIRDALRLALLAVFFQAVGTGLGPVDVAPEEPSVQLSLRDDPAWNAGPFGPGVLQDAALPGEEPARPSMDAFRVLPVPWVSTSPVQSFDRLAFSGLSPPPWSA